jgi:NADH-quinone oxidoreductase subunit J
MTLTAQDLLFYILGGLSLASALGVLLMTNPIYSALCLALTMVSLAGLYASMQAWFVAGVQLIVYAGAVMVLFVMVLMLFDLKSEIKAFSRGAVAGFMKLVAVGLMTGAFLAAIYNSADTLLGTSLAAHVDGTVSTKALAQLLFGKYVFAFEAMGVLLLIIAIGAVALSRIEGGTHADE